MLNLERKQTLLQAYETLLNNHELIESLEISTQIEGVVFRPYSGACRYVGWYTAKYCQYNVYNNTDYIENMNEQLGLDSNYPIPDEDYNIAGNKWATNNPTHNAEGRWAYVQLCVDYITKDIENHEE